MKKVNFLIIVLAFPLMVSAQQDSDEKANIVSEQLSECLALADSLKKDCLSALFANLSLTESQQESFFAFAKANGLSEDDLIVLASSNPNLNLELISSGTAAGNPGGSGLTSGTGTPLTGSTGSGGGGGGTTVSGN